MVERTFALRMWFGEGLDEVKKRRHARKTNGCAAATKRWLYVIIIIVLFSILYDCVLPSTVVYFDAHPKYVDHANAVMFENNDWYCTGE